MFKDLIQQATTAATQAQESVGQAAAQGASTAQQAAQQATSAAQSAATSAQQAAQQAATSAQNTAKSVADEAQATAQQTQTAAEEATAAAQQAAQQATVSAQQAADQAAQQAQAAAQQATTTANEAANQAQHAAQSVANEAQGLTQEAMTQAQTAANEAQQAAENAVVEAQATAQQAQQAAEQAAQEAQAQAEQAAQEVQAAAEETVNQAQQVAQEAQAQAEQAIQEAQTQAQEVVEQAQAAAEETINQAQQAAQEVAEQAQATAEEAANQVQQAAQEAQAQAEQAIQEAQAQAQEVVEQAQAAAEETINQAQEAVQQVQAQAEQAAQEAQQAVQAAVAQAQAAAGEAAAAAQGMAEEALAAAQEAAQAATAAAEQAAQQAQALAAEAANAVQEAAQAALAETQAALQSAQNGAQEALLAAQALATEAVEAAQGIIDQASEGLAEALSAIPGFGSGNRTTPNQDRLISQFTIYLRQGGFPTHDMQGLAPVEFMHDVIEIVVDDSLYLPDMFTIHVHDKELRWVDDDLISIGTRVEIRAKAGAEQGENAEQEQTLIKGEITALEPDFTDQGEPTLIIRGYDLAHRLHHGKHTRSFLQATDSEIVTKIAQEVGLTPEVKPTRPVHEYVFQNNQTNLDFLLARAQRLGYQLHVEAETLYFHPGQTDQGTGPELEWGRNLRTFRPRLSVVHQVNEVVVKGWDSKAKREIVGQAGEGEIVPQVGATENGGGGVLAQQVFQQSAQSVTVNYPVVTQDEAQALAQAICNQINGEFVQAEGICLGEPALQSGKKVQISSVGDRFSGTYFVTAATHSYSADIGYETAFIISGREPNTLNYLLNGEDDLPRETGVVIGLVTNNKDPDGLGRVKVKFPWLSAEEESAWAKIAAPMAGSGRGFYYLPEVDDEVLVAFEHGDIHRPYLVGTLWNNQDKPPKSNDEVVGSDGKVNQRIIHSRSGHQIILDDSDGSEKIEVIDKSGSNQVIINTADNAIDVTANAKVTVKAGGQTLTLDNQTQSIQLQGGGRKLVMQGGQIQMT